MKPKTNTKRAAFRDRPFSIRLTTAELEMVRQAAAPYPPTVWSRVQLVRSAEEAIKAKKKGRT